MSLTRKDNNGKEYNNSQKIKAVCKKRIINSKNKDLFNRKIVLKPK